MWFKKKLTPCKLYCMEKSTKVTEVDGKNKFNYEFMFSFIEPETMRNKFWTEYTENAKEFEEKQVYLGRYNPKTGEVIIDEKDNI